MAAHPPEPRRALRERLEATVLDGPGVTDPALRRAAAGGKNLPPELRTYVEKVRQHAYRVTDDDVDALRRAGHSEDAVFEVTVSAALGAAGERLKIALAALEEVDASREG